MKEKQSAQRMQCVKRSGLSLVGYNQGGKGDRGPGCCAQWLVSAYTQKGNGFASPQGQVPELQV